jgi:hypothetical protein
MGNDDRFSRTNRRSIRPLQAPTPRTISSFWGRRGLKVENEEVRRRKVARQLFVAEHKKQKESKQVWEFAEQKPTVVRRLERSKMSSWNGQNGF